MTKEEFRDYVDFLRSQDEISYDVYSGLIDGIDTLEQEPILDKIRAEIEQADREQIYKKSAELRSCENLYDFVKLTQGTVQAQAESEDVISILEMIRG